MSGTVRIRDLHFLYPGAAEESLRGADLSVEAGEFVAIIGNNGSGKTSLCKSLNGLIPHFHRGDMAGSVEVCGIDTRSASVGALAFHVGYVYQDFENQLLRPKVRDDVAFGPLNFGLDDYQERAARALELMELEPIADRFIWELSGGQKHLAALAGVLALDPEIIVVDEPIAQLDPVNAKRVYDRLRLLNREYGKTIIVIEHHTEFVGEFCGTVALMGEGVVDWKLPTAEALSRTDELREHDIFPPQVTQVASRIGVDGSPYPVTIAEAVSTLPRPPSRALPPAAPGQVQGVTAASNPAEDADSDTRLRPPTPGSSRLPVIRFRGVTHHYPMLDRSQHRVIDGVSLELNEGERVALVGSNGAGKSTIMRLIAGIIRPGEGTVEVGGLLTSERLAEELASTISSVFQNPQEMFIEDSVKGDVSYYPRAIGLADADEMVRFVLQRFRLDLLAERDARLLSGGQQRRVSLGIGAVARPAVLMLDEPTSSLDVANRRDVLAMLDDLSDWVKTTLIATHDMELVAEWASRVIVLEAGRVVADASPREVFTDLALVERAQLRLPQVTSLSHAMSLAPVALTVREFCERYQRVEDERVG